VVVPSGIVSTGYPAVRDKCRDLGIVHDDWQQGLGRLILGKRADGKYAATVGGVGLSIPRQVGKTFTVGSILVALCLLFPRLTVLWTAHRTRTSNETFAAMKAMTSRSKVKPFMLPPRSVNGEQEIRFRNGSRILFGAREQGFGRGFAEVDVEVFDEAQILTEKAIDDMIPAANQSKHPAGALVFFMGTPPRPIDPGEAFTRMRQTALAGLDQDSVWVEFSADADANPDDWEQIARANPSFPERTPREAILRMRKHLGDDSFMREGLGIWDGKIGVLPGWVNRFTRDAPPEPVAVGLAVSLDLDWGSIGAAGVRRDGRVHADAVERRRGSTWLIAEAKRIQAEHGCLVVVDEKCPDADLITALGDAGVNVTVAKLGDCIEAHSWIVKADRDDQIRHGNTSELNDAIENAAERMVGDRKLWGRKQSAGDISMLEAVTLAAWKAAASYDLMDSIL
jgi:hypothetical protein